MIAVIFESWPEEGRGQAYLDAAARLRPLVEAHDGFLGIERYESLATPGKFVSISWWRDEEAARRWREVEVHRQVQDYSRRTIFRDYRLRVAQVLRDYTKADRAQAPADSRAALEK